MPKIIFCIMFLMLLSACRGGKAATEPTLTDKKTADSLYTNLTPIEDMVTDKAEILRFLQQLQAQEHDIAHISESDDMHYLVFPLRVVEVIQPNKPRFCPRAKIDKGIRILNDALKDAWVQFALVEVDTVYADLDIDLLKENGFKRYFDFSYKNDLRDTCSVYLFDSADDLCRNWSCARTNGFANILDNSVNNVVLDKYFLDDFKVVPHEFGHYFGLYHTSEEQVFGKEKADGSNCRTAGDRICDTPADPGSLYSVYVNFSTCEMAGLKEESSGLEYKPQINNYMGYYPACYMRPFVFTEGQLQVIFNAAIKVRHNQVIAVAEFPLGF